MWLIKDFPLLVITISSWQQTSTTFLNWTGYCFFPNNDNSLIWVLLNCLNLRFSSCCRLYEHDSVQQESSCYFGHYTQLSLMPFSLMIIYQLLCSPIYVHLCKCLIHCQEPISNRLLRVWNKRNIEKNKHTWVTFVLRFSMASCSEVYILFEKKAQAIFTIL